MLETVDELRKAGAKKKNILKFIQEHSKCSPSIRDVHNIVQRLKAREQSSSTSSQRLKKWMVEFCEEPGNVGRIFIDPTVGKVSYDTWRYFVDELNKMISCGSTENGYVYHVPNQVNARDVRPFSGGSAHGCNTRDQCVQV